VNVGIHYNKNREGAETAADKIRESGGMAEIFQADVSRWDEVDGMVCDVGEKLGEIDYLVVNAGSMIRRCPVAEANYELWDEVVGANLSSVFYTCRAVLPAMIKRRKGVIVTVSSVAGRMGGGPGAVLYAAAKGGVLCFTKGLAKEVVGYGVRVNGVAPGVIETPFHERFSTPEIMENFRRQVPLGRLGRPEEVARVIVFLLSDEASYLVGETIEVNGGLLTD
jgi:NAD(P)-dependent dehydrogenase (short-subunit alcohol dehydrogenase family)